MVDQREGARGPRREAGGERKIRLGGPQADERACLGDPGRGEPRSFDPPDQTWLGPRGDPAEGKP